MLEQENYEAVITELTTLGFTSIFKDDYQNIMSKEKIDYNIQDGILVSVEKMIISPVMVLIIILEIMVVSTIVLLKT